MHTGGRNTNQLLCVCWLGRKIQVSTEDKLLKKIFKKIGLFLKEFLNVPLLNEYKEDAINNKNKEKK